MNPYEMEEARADYEARMEYEATQNEATRPTEPKCSRCGARAYPTPNGTQCAAYSNHRDVIPF